MPEYISRIEMIAALTSRPGTRISLRYFSEEEYLYLGNDGKVYDENGYLFEDWYTDAHDGIRMRNGGAWEDGWYILQPAA